MLVHNRYFLEITSTYQGFDNWATYFLSHLVLYQETLSLANVSMELCVPLELVKIKILKLVFSVQLQLLFNYHDSYINLDLGKVDEGILKYVVGFLCLQLTMNQRRLLTSHPNYFTLCQNATVCGYTKQNLVIFPNI